MGRIVFAGIAAARERERETSGLDQVLAERNGVAAALPQPGHRVRLVPA